MAAEFTNLAALSNFYTDKQNSDEDANSSEDFLGNSTHEKGYNKVVVLKDNLTLSGQDIAVSTTKNNSNIKGTTISFRNIEYIVESKIRKEKVAKTIVKGIR